MSLFRSWPGKLALAVVLGLALWFLGERLGNRQLFNPYYFRIIMLVGISGILAVSLNLVNGVTGQFSIGHAGFMAVGAYAAAAFSVYGQHRFLPVLKQAPLWQQHSALLAALLLGGVVAAVAGLVVGLPSLRLKGDYLAIVTLGFGEIIRVTIQNVDALGGPAGFPGYTHPQFGRVLIPSITSFLWVYGTLVLLVMLSRNILRSSHGLLFFSIREDEVAAEAMGVNTTRVKVTAFVISAFFAGVAGGLFAHYDAYVKPDMFNFLRSIEIITMVVLGGSGSVTGALLGAVILTAAPEFLRNWLGELAKKGVIHKNISPDVVRQLLYALLLIVLMLARPQGLLGHRELSLRWLFARRRRV